MSGGPAKLVLAAVSTGILACTASNRDTARVLDHLRDEYGKAAIVRVGYLGDSTDLLIHVAAPAFAALSDSLFDATARRMARMAVEQYARAVELDSVLVSAIEPGRDNAVVLERRRVHLAISDIH